MFAWFIFELVAIKNQAVFFILVNVRLKGFYFIVPEPRIELRTTAIRG